MKLSGSRYKTHKKKEVLLHKLPNYTVKLIATGCYRSQKHK